MRDVKQPILYIIENKLKLNFNKIAHRFKNNELRGIDENITDLAAGAKLTRQLAKKIPRSQKKIRKSLIELSNELMTDCSTLKDLFKNQPTSNVFLDSDKANIFNRIGTIVKAEEAFAGKIGNINALENENKKVLKEFSIFCSNRFMERFKDNKFNQSEIKDKFEAILLNNIISPSKSVEKIGKFLISPQGDKDYRLAWFKKGRKIYLCEQFLHDREYDRFCDRSRHREITLAFYGDIKSDDWKPIKRPFAANY